MSVAVLMPVSLTQMSQGLLNERVRSVQPHSAKVLDNGFRHRDHTSTLGAQYDSEGADQRKAHGLRTTACLKIIQDGTAAWGGSSEGNHLRLSSSEIPGREICRNGSLSFHARTGERSDRGQRPFTPRLCSDLAYDRFRNDDLV